jgi:hypothetical protein
MVEKARIPALAVVISQVGIAALAALGLQAWCRGRRSRAVIWGLVLFGAGVLAIYGWLAVSHREPANYGTATVAVVALALAAVLRGSTARPGALPCIVFVLFMVEAVTVAPRLGRFDRPGSYFNTIHSQQDIAGFLKRQPGWFRFEVDDAEIPYNFGELYGLEQFGGGVSSMLTRVHGILGNPETPRLFGVQYRVARTPSNQAQVEVFQSRSGLKVYRDPRIGQSLWSRHPTPCGAPDGLRIVTRQPEVFIVEADMACAGQVVSGDPWFPGWRAWVDGKRVRIADAEGVVRGVPVDRGRHRIEFRFRPGSVYWGAALCAAGFMLTAYLFAQDHGNIGIHTHNGAARDIAAR